MWKRLRQRLSAKEMLAVTSVVLLTAGIIYGGYRSAAALWHRRLLAQAIPGALAGARAQRDILVDLIESYKSRFGYYPPLFTAAGLDRGVINPLCYELMGARFEAKTRQFYIPATKDGLSVDVVENYFHMHSFSNCLVFPRLPTNFLANQPLSVSPLTQDGEIFGVGLGYTDFTPEGFWDDFQVSPWRYVTNPAEHNPGKFDVWVDIKVAGKHFRIGNWPEVN